jgi:hypothetical protein
MLHPEPRSVDEGGMRIHTSQDIIHACIPASYEVYGHALVDLFDVIHTQPEDKLVGSSIDEVQDRYDVVRVPTLAWLES